MNKCVSELSPKEKRKLTLGLSLLRQDGTPSKAAELAARDLGFQAQQHAWALLEDHQGGSLEFEEGDLDLEDLVTAHPSEFSPLQGGWICEVRVHIPALPWSPRHAAKEFEISQSLWDMGFFCEGENGSGQAVEVRWCLAPAKAGTGSVLRASAELDIPANLIKRSSWLPKSLGRTLQDGGEVVMKAAGKGGQDRVIQLWPPQAEWCGGLVCRGFRAWKLAASDLKGWMVLEALESDHCTSTSIGVLLSRLGFQETGAGAALTEQGPHHERATQALTSLIRQLTLFHPLGGEGNWVWDWLGGQSRTWEPSRRGTVGRLVAKFGARPSEGTIVVRGGPSREVVYTFTAEGDLLDPANLEAQKARLIQELTRIWGPNLLP